MGAAMGCIVTKIPPDIQLSEGEEAEKFSHWAIIHTDWGICKLLIPRKLDVDVVVQINIFGAAKSEEVTFRGERTEDAKAFVEQIEKRLNKVMTRQAELQKQLYITEGGRIH